MEFLDRVGQEIVTVDSNRSWRDIETDEHLLPKGRERAPAAAVIITLQWKDILS